MEELKQEFDRTTITELKYRINFCRQFLNKISFHTQKINFSKLNLIHSIQVECNLIKELIDKKVSEMIFEIDKQEIEKQNQLKITQNSVKTELNILEHCLTQYNKNIKKNNDNDNILNMINNQLYCIKNEYNINIATFKFHDIKIDRLLLDKFIKSFHIENIEADIGKYTYTKELCYTLQGRIYSGINIITENEVIIKEGWKHLVNNEISRNQIKIAENFINEAKLSLELSNMPDCPEYICKTYDFWEKNDAYYYAMEKCDISLFDFVKQSYKTNKNKKMYFKQIKQIFINIIVAVNWLHKHNVCHLDLSLENIMLKRKGKTYIAKVIDFGLAQKVDKKNPYCHRTVGKISYLSPEAYQRKQYNGKKADIYSLGVILFTMLTGSLPYKKPSTSDMTYKLIKNNKMGSVLKYLGINHEIDSNGYDLVKKMMKPEKNRISMKSILFHPFLEVSCKKSSRHSC